MVGLPGSWLPFGPLAGHDPGQPVQVGDDFGVDRLVETEQASMVGQQLPDGDPLFPFCANLGQ